MTVFLYPDSPDIVSAIHDGKYESFLKRNRVLSSAHKSPAKASVQKRRKRVKTDLLASYETLKYALTTLPSQPFHRPATPGQLPRLNYRSFSMPGCRGIGLSASTHLLYQMRGFRPKPNVPYLALRNACHLPRTLRPRSQARLSSPRPEQFPRQSLLRQRQPHCAPGTNAIAPRTGYNTCVRLINPARSSARIPAQGEQQTEKFEYIWTPRNGIRLPQLPNNPTYFVQ
jgi:hypothetical protein